jgi:2-polyprenyl-3-methyl-5-hydroxy-6-metoxy-1,4-benzoquinol methylase
VPSKVLPKLLGLLGHRDHPTILDLGPAIGANVTFFGERLGCRLIVEDLYTELDQFAREGRMGEFGAFLARRLAHPEHSVDAVLCWDLFDYLDKPSAQALGAALARLVKPGGALFGFFATAAATDQHYTRFVVVDDTTLEHRTYPGSRARQLVLLNRDVAMLFPGLNVSESFLLLAHTREVLFRRP